MIQNMNLVYRHDIAESGVKHQKSNKIMNLSDWLLFNVKYVKWAVYISYVHVEADLNLYHALGYWRNN